MVVIRHNGPYHQSGSVADWLKQQQRIRVKFLPPYPLNLNVIE
jgi:hypothetical protein